MPFVTKHLKMLGGYIFLLVLSCNSMAWGQQALLGPKVDLFTPDTIEIDGLKKVEKEAVLERLQSKPGIPIDNYLLRKDIERIYGLKYFERVEAHKEKKDGKTVLIFRVSEKPVIQTIRFEGNDDISSDDLKDKIKVKVMSIVDVNAIKTDLKTLTKHYEDKGYFLATVNFEIRPLGPEMVELVYKVTESEKVRVKKITFLGNKDLQDAELKKYMQTREEGMFSFMSSAGSFKEEDFQVDVERLSYFYKSKGYLQINISNPIVTVSQDKKWIFISIAINEGPKFSVEKIRFDGDLLFTDEQLREKLELKEGEIYSEDLLRKDILALTEKYQDEGYAFANVLRNLEPVPGENKVDIVYTFEKGKIVYFGDIIVKGNSRTRDKVVRRELRIHEGMKYSGSLLKTSKENVNRLGFFEPESVVFNTISPKGKDDVLNVEISVKERQTGQISLGAGYSSAYNMFIQASIAQNNFDGRGMSLNADFQKSGSLQTTYRLGLTDPYFRDTKWTLGGDIYSTRNALVRSFVYQKNGFDLRTGYQIFDFTRLYLSYNFEQTKVIGNPIAGKRLDNGQDVINADLENGTASSLQASFLRDRRNNMFEPTKGYYLNISTEYTGLGGTQRWVKNDFDGRFYRPIVGDLVFRSRMWVGQILRTTERGIPMSERFQLGGPRNMRGYNIGDIGPHVLAVNSLTGLPTSFNTGGLFQVLTTFEVEHPLVKEAGLKWVLFYDAGNVYEKYIGYDNKYNLRADYGFGFRWFSPIGVMRFEFGYPIAKRANEAGQQFNFDIGQLF